MKKLITLLLLFPLLNAGAQNCVPNTNSLSFDGSSTYVSFPPNSTLNIPDVITVEAWVYATAWGVTSAQGSIVCKHGWSNGEKGYVLRAGGQGQLSFNIAGEDAVIDWREVVSPINALQLNAWYHVAGTFDGNQLKLYIDGNLVDSTSFVGTMVPSPDYYLKIGKLADDSQPDFRGWSGNIDEVRIWHRALSQTEIDANRLTHIDPISASDLIGYWRMNDGTGNSVTDFGPAGATGTLVNASWSTLVPFNSGPVTPLISESGGTLYSSSPAGNQWNLNGTAIPGAINSSYVPLQNGTYTVTVTDINNCSATSAQFVVTTAGIGEANASVVFSQLSDGVYSFHSPNLPVKDILALDQTGRKVSVYEGSGNSGSFDMGMLAKGIYILRIHFADGSYGTSRVLLN